jgi:hypothetical protein
MPTKAKTYYGHATCAHGKTHTAVSAVSQSDADTRARNAASSCGGH